MILFECGSLSSRGGDEDVIFVVILVEICVDVLFSPHSKYQRHPLECMDPMVETVNQWKARIRGVY